MLDGGIRMYGATWCSDCKRAKKFFGEHRVAYDFVDVEADAEGLRIVEETNGGKRIIPTIFFPDGSTWSSRRTPSWRRSSACRPALARRSTIWRSSAVARPA
jgi:glutaredoxin